MDLIQLKIETNDFVIGFNLEYYDVLEDINGVDRRGKFCNMIHALGQAGAQISIYQNEELITKELLDNWIKTLDETGRQTECDIERELGQ